MKQYIGTKMIMAAPALRLDDGKGDVRIELLSSNPMPLPGDIVDMGYKVVYPDGYESWSPQDVFEAAYCPTDGMNFGLAIEAAKQGKKIARADWNGKGMFLYHGAYIAMKTAQGKVVPWLASQTDMLADDWYIVE